MIITINGKNGGFLKVSRVYGVEIVMDKEEVYVRHGPRFTKVTGVKFVEFGISETPHNASIGNESKDSFYAMETFDMSNSEKNAGVKKI